ncbi:MAG: hypothetical protein JWM53_4274, partial [bacterium]|nr:hypothetical protein [bacterium]
AMLLRKPFELPELHAAIDAMLASSSR